MQKEIRNIVITAVVALFVGYMAGGIIHTGHCPLTGTVIWKDKAEACCTKKHAEEKACCAKKDAAAAEATPVTDEAPAAESTEAAH